MPDHVTSAASSIPFSFFFAHETESQGLSSPPSKGISLYKDGRLVEGNCVGRKVLNRIQETYNFELNGKDFAYDMARKLFTLGSLARNRLEFTVVLEDVLCPLVSLQRYTKALTTLQRSSLVEKSRQKPLERMRVLTNALSQNYDGFEPMLRNCGNSINSSFIEVEGHVLQAPRV
ncbi:hypothetical protein VIGAN_09141700 [Vigna angularis var. angularis]|uniref:Uncharacterized protein n=1 Tax=Vigna angularis var. angularis TaxID=157739 RepID=A0A0S3SY61_PHAAN|nr:hypothetical protein VIGAN_09141700 [Vigna angularis var. angularis]